MAAPREGYPSERPLDQLALGFNAAVMERRAAIVIPDVYRQLWRQVTAHLAQSPEPIVSAAAVEIAFESTLREFKELLSPFAQERLVQFLVEQRPALETEPLADDFYTRTVIEIFDSEQIFNRIVAGLELEEHDQLSFDDEHPADTI